MIEVADNWWFIKELINLSSEPLDKIFTNRFAPLSTEAIFLHYLFGQAHRPDHLAKRFINSQVKHLERNQSVVKVSDDLWLLAETVNDFTREIVDRLAQLGRPESYRDLVKTIVAPKLSKTIISESLNDFLLSRLRQDSQVIEICDGIWLHRVTIETTLNRAYLVLQGSRARTGSELLLECISISLNIDHYNSSFVKEFERALQQDDRFIPDYQQNLWTVVPLGDRKNNLAYIVLYQEGKPLSRQQIINQAKNLPYVQSLAFQLESDTRFKRLASGRWILAKWTLINDLAATYLAQSPIPLLAETIKQKVCEIHNINPTDAIFEPEDDPRFTRDSLGKWLCQPSKIISQEMLERLVQSASDATNGITLEVLVRKSLHDHPSAYYNLEQTLLDDGRLIFCNGLWYPRDKCFYCVTIDDIERVKTHIVQVGYPVSIDVLAKDCLNKFACLTDLGEKLAGSSEFVELGSAGWIVKGLKPESSGRKREVNYPIRSGKYLPTINVEDFENVDEKDNDSGSSALPEKADGQIKREGQVRYITITLSFEDIRDGSVIVTSRMRWLLSDGLEMPALRFTDEEGTSFSCWRDDDNNLLHGFGNWFKSRSLTFGDKIRFRTAEKDDHVLVYPVIGERNEQVYLDGVRRSQVQNIIDEAKRVNCSYHDLMLEVLEYFGTPLHIDDLWAMVNYRRIARKQTLSAILSSRPYFVSEGNGYWCFDKEEYVQMIRELERQVRRLEKDNQKLRDEKETLSHQILETQNLQHQLDQLRKSLEASEEESSQSKREVEELKSELIAVKDKANKAETLLTQTTDKYNQTQALLKTTTEQEINAFSAKLQKQAEVTINLEQENQQLAASLTALMAQLKAYSEIEVELRKRIDELEKSLQQVDSEVSKFRQHAQTLENTLIEREREEQELVQQRAQILQDLRQQIADLEQDNQHLRDENEAVSYQVLEAIRLQNQLSELRSSVATSEETLKRLMTQIETLKSELTAAQDRADKAEILANQTAEKYEQTQASLTTAEPEIAILQAKLQERTQMIASLEESNRQLSVDISSLKVQLETISETESNLRRRIAELEGDLQRANTEVVKVRQDNQSLKESLDQVNAEQQKTVKQLTRLTSEYKDLKTEFAKAMVILDSWGGSLAKGWALLLSKDLPTWPQRTKH